MSYKKEIRACAKLSQLKKSEKNIYSVIDVFSCLSTYYPTPTLTQLPNFHQDRSRSPPTLVEGGMDHCQPRQGV